MRRTLLAAVVNLLLILPSLAQQGPPQHIEIGVLLTQLRSKDAGVRSNAYYQLESDPTSLRNAKVKAALLDLLDREARDITNYDGSEGFAEYISDLSGTVAPLVDWDDQLQACRAVKDGIGPPADTPEEAAGREKLVWPCLKEMSASNWILDRNGASGVIIELSARAGKALDPLIAKEAKETIVKFLHDPYEGVRDDAVESLAKYGTEEAVPALKQVAETDPATDRVDHSYWIRKRAARAIAEIQKRAGYPNKENTSPQN
jgi:hypothetical protein